MYVTCPHSHAHVQLRPHRLNTGVSKIISQYSNSPTSEKKVPLDTVEIPDGYVSNNTREWNKAIGEWTFEGISPVAPPSSHNGLKVTNEVRVPTPIVTPQGSTDNLLEIESRSDMYSE